MPIDYALFPYLYKWKSPRGKSKGSLINSHSSLMVLKISKYVRDMGF